MAVICAPAGAARPAPGAKGHFSLDFINSELVDVLKALATQSGVNVVLTSSVKGQTTLSLHNVTLEEALRLVTASNGLDYAWVDVAYVVGTPEEVRNMRVKELSSRAVLLRRITPKYAQDVLGRVTPEVAVSYQEGSPSLVLIGTEAALNRAERTLARIDVPLPPSTRMIGLLHAGARGRFAFQQ
jgi:type II secretory pathway component GspD/PulD (secretin)